MDRAEKRELVTGLNEAFGNAGSVVVAHYAGITVAQMNDLRSKMRAAGGTVKVAKNRLAKIALQGTDSASIIDLFKGQTLIAYSEDPTAAARIADKYAKDNERFVILGGAMGDSALDPAGVKAVASMPSREELIAQIVSCLGAPASNIAGAIGAPASNIASILTTLEEREAA